MALPVIQVTPTDGSTTLNVGTGGDLMDETQVSYLDVDTQVTTTRKRSRVVLGGDDGSVVDVDVSPARVATHVCDSNAAGLLSELLVHAQLQTGLLKAIAIALGAEDDNQALMELGSASDC